MAAFDVDAKITTILSIDGGGVRGIIPATIILALENELKSLDGDNVSIADYFDIIAGTSTGGLITALLTTPDENHKPLYDAQAVVNFYLDQCNKIFPKDPPKTALMLFRVSGWFDIVKEFAEWLASKIGVGYEYVKEGLVWFEKFAFKPTYTGAALHEIIQKTVGLTRINETLTNVLITSFDIHYLQPVVFSTLEAKRDPSKNVLLSDAGIGTSAAPTFFPPYYFENKASTGPPTKYNLVDGGVATNNPTLLAVLETGKEASKSKKMIDAMKNIDSSKLLVLSLGTGSSKRNLGSLVSDNGSWGVYQWFVNPKGNQPLIDVFQSGSQDLVSVYLSAFFDVSNYTPNYLRIQDDTLTIEDSAMDNSDHDHLLYLEDFAKKLLEKPFAALNLETGMYDEIPDPTFLFKDALKDFAKNLSDVKKARLAANKK